MTLRFLSLFALFLIALSCTNPKPETPKAVLVIHGGAGWISKESVSDSMEKKYTETLGEGSHAAQHIDAVGQRRARTTWVIPNGHYFMMGDNRDNSADSREWGAVPEENIVGKAIAVWMHKDPGLNLPTFSRNQLIY